MDNATTRGPFEPIHTGIYYDQDIYQTARDCPMTNQTVSETRHTHPYPPVQSQSRVINHALDTEWPIRQGSGKSRKSVYLSRQSVRSLQSHVPSCLSSAQASGPGGFESNPWFAPGWCCHTQPGRSQYDRRCESNGPCTGLGAVTGKCCICLTLEREEEESEHCVEDKNDNTCSSRVHISRTR